MTGDVHTQEVAAGFVTKIANMTRQGAEPVPLATLTDYARLLAAELPSTAFTQASLAFCLADTQYFPDYSTLRKNLVEWWNNNAPRSAPRVLQVTDGDGPLGREDQCWLDYYWKHVPGASEERRAHLASLVRKMSPPAWRRIAGPPPPRYVPSPADLAAIRAAVASLRGGGGASEPLEGAQRPSNAANSTCETFEPVRPNKPWVDDMRRAAGYATVKKPERYDPKDQGDEFA